MRAGSESKRSVSGGEGRAGGWGLGVGEGVDGPVPFKRAAGVKRADGAQPQRGSARVPRGRGDPFPPPPPPPTGPLRALDQREGFWRKNERGFSSDEGGAFFG